MGIGTRIGTKIGAVIITGPPNTTGPIEPYDAP